MSRLKHNNFPMPSQGKGENPFQPKRIISHFIPLLLCAALLAFFIPATNDASAESSVRPPAGAVTNKIPSINNDNEAVKGNVPGHAIGNYSDSDTWRDIRKGVQGSVSISDQKSAVLVQSDGEAYRLMRTGPLFSNLGILMFATVLALALFYAIRGKIRVERGLSGRTIKRFTTIERMGHWLMAISFIILGLSGLNITFGKTVIMPIIGKSAFGPLAGFLKVAHNYVAFSFMLGLAVAFVCWVIHNIPDKTDLNWLAKGGGLFTKGSHPPSKKFNAGQKIIFWGVMLGGLSLSFSGWALLFPFEHTFFTDTFHAFSVIGIDIPAILGMPELPYSVIQEQQYNSIWHAIVAVIMICLILAHIYIGSIGMEGAFDAMGSGDVDENWAIEHHSLWVEEVTGEKISDHSPNKVQPAE